MKNFKEFINESKYTMHTWQDLNLYSITIEYESGDWDNATIVTPYKEKEVIKYVKDRWNAKIINIQKEDLTKWDGLITNYLF